MKRSRLMVLVLLSAFLSVGIPISPANASYTLVTINSTVKNWQSITASNDGTKIAAVVSQDGIYVSTDSGVSFTNRTSALSTQPSWNKIVSSADGRYLAASAYVFGTWVGGVYVSSDYGTTWTKVITPAQGGISSIAMSSDGSKIIAAVSNGGGNAGVIPIYRSSNYGATWTNTNTGLPAIAVDGNFDGVTISDDGVKLAASYDGVAGSGVIYSTDSGASWTEASGIPAGSGPLAANSDGSKIAFKTGTNPVYFSGDSGVSWSSSSWSGTYPGGLTMSSDGNNVVLMTSGMWSYVLYVSLDGGATRTSQNLASDSSWNLFMNRAGTKVFLSGYDRGIYSIDLGPVVTSPGAPTIGTATALSPTSASISFTAPASNGGATIETYTATSTPGSITGRLLQSGSGSITVTGLTASTAYTFRVTASNSSGTSSASSATVSITTPASQAEIESAALAAQKAAIVEREAKKNSARAEITNRYKNNEKVSIETFNQAEIPGIAPENIEAVNAEILALPEQSRAQIIQVLKVARKYEVVGIIASDRIVSTYSKDLIEGGFIPADSKNKAALTAAVKDLDAIVRASLMDVREIIRLHTEEIRARIEKQAIIVLKIKSRRSSERQELTLSDRGSPRSFLSGNTPPSHKFHA